MGVILGGMVSSHKARIKLMLLMLVAIHALVFRGSVYNNAAALDQSRGMPGKAKLAAALSLLLWISIACAGRGIGYIEPPLEKLHALVTNLIATAVQPE